MAQVFSGVLTVYFFLVICNSITHARTQKSGSHPSLQSNDSSSGMKHGELQTFAHSQTNYDIGSMDLNCSKYILEKEYVLLENGTLLLPGSDSTLEYKTYFLENDTAFFCADKVVTATAGPVYKFNAAFLKCGHMLVDNNEFQLFENGSLYIGIYSTMYAPGDYYLLEHGVYVCVPRFSELPRFSEINANITQLEILSNHLNKFPESFSYVTYAGLIVSIVSLLSHLVIFCIVSSVRNLPGCCLASLSLSLLLAYSCFLAIEVLKTKKYCASLGMCVYYFFLTSFFWMNAIAFDVWRSFRVVMKELRISSHRVPWRRFLLYSMYSWVIPALLAVLVKMCDLTDILPEEYKPSFGDPICWFGQRKSLAVFFAVPLCAVMLLNAIFFFDVTYVISRATLKASQCRDATLKKRFFMFMRLSLIMGLTWIVGLVAGYADNHVMWYMFVVLNTLQGLFIFVVFSCSSKVRGLFCKKYRRRSKSRGNTSVRTISSAVV